MFGFYGLSMDWIDTQWQLYRIRCTCTKTGKRRILPSWALRLIQWKSPEIKCTCTCLRATIIRYMCVQCSTDILTGSHIVAGAESKLTGLLVGEWEEPVHCVCNICDCGEEAESITWWAGSIVWEWAESTLADQWSGCCWACWDTDDISLPPVLCICVWCPHCNIPTCIRHVTQYTKLYQKTLVLLAMWSIDSNVSIWSNSLRPHHFSAFSSYDQASNQ